MISREEVKKIAELSLLAVEENELDVLTHEIGSILRYISDVNSLTAEEGDEKKEKPLLYNVMRADTVTNEKGLYTKKILGEAPKTDGHYLRVKKIL
jgi:aspartyl/glutamyl-tRNA(Asn/Gln) amidotransferase C subunit